MIQDTWIAALRGVRKFEGRSRLSTWILRILAYRARTHGKRASRSVPFSLASLAPGAIDEAEPLFARPAAPPDEVADAREMRDVLARSLLDLAPRQRQAFRLRELNGLSASETALSGLCEGSSCERALRVFC